MRKSLKNRMITMVAGSLSAMMAACASSPEVAPAPKDTMPKVQLTQDDFFRAELIRAEFTDEVDEQRYKAIGEVLDEISPRQKVIYFVGKLRNVPTQASIEVQWFNDRIEEPQVVTEVHGSDTFSFISSFTPPGRRFIPGNYTVRVLVNDRVAGTDTFVITGQDPFANGITVKKLKVAKKLRKNSTPIKPAVRFKNAKELHATFMLANVLSESELKIIWTRGDDVFSESTVLATGKGRYHSNIASPTGLPRGLYHVEIEHDGVTLEKLKFSIGNVSMGPAIDAVTVDAKLGKNSFPAGDKDKLKGPVSTLYCGVRFLDLASDSEILVEWVQMEDGEPSVYHEVLTPIPNGGSGTMTAPWSAGEIYPGEYQAVVYINDEEAGSKSFLIK